MPKQAKGNVKTDAIREVLFDLSRESFNNTIMAKKIDRDFIVEYIEEQIDSAITSIVKIVEKERKHSAYHKQWNACCDHITKLIRGKITKKEAHR